MATQARGSRPSGPPVLQSLCARVPQRPATCSAAAAARRTHTQSVGRAPGGGRAPGRSGEREPSPPADTPTPTSTVGRLWLRTRFGGPDVGQDEGRARPRGRGVSGRESPALHATASHPPQTATHSRNLRLWILGGPAPSGTGQRSTSFWGSALGGSSDLLCSVGAGDAGSSVPSATSQRKGPWHRPAGQGLRSSHVASPPPPPSATAGRTGTGRVPTAWEKQEPGHCSALPQPQLSY